MFFLGVVFNQQSVTLSSVELIQGRQYKHRLYVKYCQTADLLQRINTSCFDLRSYLPIGHPPCDHINRKDIIVRCPSPRLKNEKADKL